MEDKDKFYEWLLSQIKEYLEKDRLQQIEMIFDTLKPEDAVEVIKHIEPEHKLLLFNLLNDEQRAIAFDILDVRSKKYLLRYLQDDEVVEILMDMDPDDATDVLNLMKESRATRILNLLEEEERKNVEEIEELLTYDPFTAGGIMSRDYVAVLEHDTVAEAMIRIREADTQDESLSNLCVVDDHNHLLGTLSVKSIITASPDTKISELYESDPLRVHTMVDQEEVAKMFMRYDLYTLAVVDNQNKLVGIIYSDDIMDVLVQEGTEDIYKMVGSSGEEVLELSITQVVKMRFPWLLTSMGLSIITVILIDFNQSIKHSYLAFIPIVMAMSGNIGVQSATIIIRGLSTGRIHISSIMGFFLRELKIGFLLGLSCGTFVGILGTVMKFINKDPDVNPFELGIAVGVALICSLTGAAIMGSAIPIVLKKMKLDPAVASGPFVTTLNDVISVVIYFVFAELLTMFF